MRTERLIRGQDLDRGGWSLVSLVTLTLWPGLSPAAAPVAVLSIGAAVALGLYGAWMHRDWPTATRTAGLVAVVAGAMLGAWFGFGAAGGVLMPIATIAGAAAVGNLALIIVDSSIQQASGGAAKPDGPHGRGPSGTAVTRTPRRRS